MHCWCNFLWFQLGAFISCFFVFNRVVHSCKLCVLYGQVHFTFSGLFGPGKEPIIKMTIIISSQSLHRLLHSMYNMVMPWHCFHPFLSSKSPSRALLPCFSGSSKETVTSLCWNTDTAIRMQRDTAYDMSSDTHKGSVRLIRKRGGIVDAAEIYSQRKDLRTRQNRNRCNGMMSSHGTEINKYWSE